MATQASVIVKGPEIWGNFGPRIRSFFYVCMSVCIICHIKKYRHAIIIDMKNRYYTIL